MKAQIAVVGIAGLLGCMDESAETDGTLQLEPAALTVTVIDGVVATQAFRATFISDDGTTRDVTEEATFGLADAAFGAWTGDTLALDGAVVGPTRVVASWGRARGEAPVTVFARIAMLDVGLEGAPATFAAASIDPSCAPEITYPLAGALLPLNHGQLDVQFDDQRDDLFEVSLATTYLAVRLYTNDPESARLPSALWSRLANEQEPITVRMNGLVQAAPSTKCASTAQRLYVTDQGLEGTAHFWTAWGIWRHEGTALDSDPSMLPPWSSSTTVLATTTTAPPPVTCAGCAFSRDGKRVAMPAYGMIYDVDARAFSVPMNGDLPRTWTGGAFNPAGDKLFVAEESQLSLIAIDGSELAALPPGYFLTSDPELSADGVWLANAESTLEGSRILVRRFDDATNLFGLPKTIVERQFGVATVRPSWSPDGQWLAFTHITSTGASIWVVKSDGSQPPIQVTAPTANVDVAARWVPSMNTSRSHGFYYLTFSSDRAYGQHPRGRLQMWAAPFYPDRASAGGYPMGEAFHLPFQSPDADTQIAAWTR